MLTRVGAAARRAGSTVEDFQRHWRTSHGPTAGAIPNLLRYVQYHAVVRDAALVLPYPGFDACSELDFESPAAMDDGFAQAAARGELQADEARFVDKQRYSWVLGEREERRASRRPADPVTLVTWWRTHPASTDERLVATLRSEWEYESAAPGGRWLVVARVDWHAGRPGPSATAVELVEFDGVTAALAWLRGPAAQAGPCLAGLAFGSERHLATPVTIPLGDPGAPG